MVTGPLQPSLHRPRLTPGALYVVAVTAFALLLLVLASARLVDPAAVVLVGVPLGPVGVVAAVLALPAFTTPPSLAVGALVLVGVLAVATVDVLAVAIVSAAASGRPVLRR